MKMKYCPNCASMTFKAAQGGGEQCKKCGYAGEMKWDSVDVINSLGRRLKGGNVPAVKKRSREVEDIEGFEVKSEEEKENEEAKGFGARLPERKAGQGSSGGLSPSELKEKMKGKGSIDWEII